MPKNFEEKMVAANLGLVLIFAVLLTAIRAPNGCREPLSMSIGDLVEGLLILGFLFLMGCTALVSVAVWLHCWWKGAITIRPRFRFLTAAPAILLVPFFLLPTGPSFKDQTAEHASELQAYYDRAGHFPKTLAEAGLETPTTECYGDWNYRVFDNGHDYELTIGDYNTYGWVEGWRRGHYFVNT